MKLTAKKSLGQNFLRSQKALDDIVNSVLDNLPDKKKLIIEIGGGEGVLTQELLKNNLRVKVVELDRRAVVEMNQKFAAQIKSEQCEIVLADILQTDLSKLSGGKDYLIVGNIPYYITGLIFRHVFGQKNLPSSATFMVQKEVAQRVLAADGKESLLSLSLKFYGTTRIVSVVKRGSFVPAPNVDSAILEISKIQKRDKDFTILEEKFFELIHLAFRHPRKFALSNIKKYIEKEDDIENHKENKDQYQKIEKYFLEHNLQKQRPEDFTLQSWLDVLKSL